VGAATKPTFHFVNLCFQHKLCSSFAQFVSNPAKNINDVPNNQGTRHCGRAFLVSSDRILNEWWILARQVTWVHIVHVSRQIHLNRLVNWRSSWRDSGPSNVCWLSWSVLQLLETGMRSQSLLQERSREITVMALPEPVTISYMSTMCGAASTTGASAVLIFSLIHADFFVFYIPQK
jgi:hypothetical protein